MKVSIEISSQIIADLMVTAIEGNDMTRSWCEGVYLLSPTESTNDVWYSKKEIFESAFKIQVNEIIDESKAAIGENLKEHIVTSVDFANGFRLMFEKSGSHFGDIFSENYDAITADVWLQYVALKEVVYG